MKKSRVRVFLLHRRLLAVLCTLAVAAGIFYVTLYPASQAAAASTRQLPIYSVERKEKLCSISFDAAWVMGKCGSSVAELPHFVSYHASFLEFSS